jgi:hypothetical protein
LSSESKPILEAPLIHLEDAKQSTAGSFLIYLHHISLPLYIPKKCDANMASPYQRNVAKKCDANLCLSIPKKCGKEMWCKYGLSIPTKCGKEM